MGKFDEWVNKAKVATIAGLTAVSSYVNAPNTPQQTSDSNMKNNAPKEVKQTPPRQDDNDKEIPSLNDFIQEYNQVQTPADQTPPVEATPEVKQPEQLTPDQVPMQDDQVVADSVPATPEIAPMEGIKNIDMRNFVDVHDNPNYRGGNFRFDSVPPEAPTVIEGAISWNEKIDFIIQSYGDNGVVIEESKKDPFVSNFEVYMRNDIIYYTEHKPESIFYAEQKTTHKFAPDAHFMETTRCKKYFNGTKDTPVTSHTEFSRDGEMTKTSTMTRQRAGYTYNVSEPTEQFYNNHRDLFDHKTNGMPYDAMRIIPEGTEFIKLDDNPLTPTIVYDYVKFGSEYENSEHRVEIPIRDNPGTLKEEIDKFNEVAKNGVRCGSTFEKGEDGASIVRNHLDFDKIVKLERQLTLEKNSKSLKQMHEMDGVWQQHNDLSLENSNAALYKNIRGLYEQALQAQSEGKTDIKYMQQIQEIARNTEKTGQDNLEYSADGKMWRRVTQTEQNHGISFEKETKLHPAYDDIATELEYYNNSNYTAPDKEAVLQFYAETRPYLYKTTDVVYLGGRTKPTKTIEYGYTDSDEKVSVVVWDNPGTEKEVLKEYNKHVKNGAHVHYGKNAASAWNSNNNKSIIEVDKEIIKNETAAESKKYEDSKQLYQQMEQQWAQHNEPTNALGNVQKLENSDKANETVVINSENQNTIQPQEEVAQAPKTKAEILMEKSGRSLKEGAWQAKSSVTNTQTKAKSSSTTPLTQIASQRGGMES